MQNPFDELKLTITFHHPLGQIPSRDLRKTILHCEEALAQSEWFDIFAVSNQLDLPAHISHAMLWRLEGMKGDIIQIEYARKGSIVLGAIIAATAFWILENTLGEAFKEAWKETGMRKKVKEVLTHRFEFKKKEIAEEIQKRIESDDELSLKVSYEITSDKETSMAVFIHITPEFEQYPAPKRKDITFD